MKPPIRIVAVGDLSLNGGYARALKRHGPGHPFRHVAPAWRGADLLLGNLESPLTTSRRASPSKLTLRAVPGALEAVLEAGFDCLALANNHAMDFGPDGLAQTLQQLASAGLPAVGAGQDQDQACAPVVLRRQGQSVGLLSFCDVEQRSPLYAGAGTPGVARFEVHDAVHRVRQLRGQVDWVVVQLHWGQELAELPLPQQRNAARALVDAGADLILGHHPHVLQPLEFIAGVPVFYSVGNFLFSEMFWRGRSLDGQGFLGKCRLHPLCARTGWAEVTLQRGRPSAARLVPARLGKDLAVRPEPTRERLRLWDRLCTRLEVADYDREAGAEMQQARERLRWQTESRSLVRRLEMRLFGYGLLPAAVEGD